MNARLAADEIAKAFVDARHSGAGLADYPGSHPQSLDEAYAIQERAIRLFGGRIAGWKVGRIPDPLVERYGVNRLAGPIFANSVIEITGEEIPEMPIFTDGFGAAEAEYLLRIGSLPERFDRVWTNEEAARFVNDIRIGIEVASSPFQGINEHGPAVTVSDFGNNNGLVIGARVEAGEEFADWPVSLLIDGAVAGAATARTMLDGPFGAVRFLFELAAERGLPLAPGQWVSTGAVTGVHEVRPGAAIEARFGETMLVRCKIGGKRQG